MSAHRNIEPGSERLPQDGADRTQLMQAPDAERTELKALVEQLRLIEEAVNAGTWHWDVASGISHWPPGISALWGLPKKAHQITFDDFASRVYPEDRERVLKTISESLDHSDSYDVEFRVVWPDGSVHWLAARGAMVRDENGHPQRVVGIALEATERIRTEEALRQTEKLAAAGRLSATIAHEINNPLEAVTNLLYLCQSDEATPPHVREMLAQADQELARVCHITRQTLGFYRDASHPLRVNVSECVSDIVRLYEKRIRSKRITVRTTLDDDAVVVANQGELRQVISNIIVNAIDAAPLDGVVAIRVRRRREGVRLIVADNGSGIRTQVRAKLFQPFFTTKKDVGTGLGLWVSRGIVDKHGGRLTVRSNTAQGKCGATFIIDLPMKHAAVANG